MAGDMHQPQPSLARTFPPNSEDFSTFFNQLLHNPPPLGMDPNHSASDFTPHTNTNNPLPSSPSTFHFSHPIPATHATTFKQHNNNHNPDFTSSAEVPPLQCLFLAPHKKVASVTHTLYTQLLKLTIKIETC